MHEQIVNQLGSDWTRSREILESGMLLWSRGESVEVQHIKIKLILFPTILFFRTIFSCNHAESEARLASGSDNCGLWANDMLK